MIFEVCRPTTDNSELAICHVLRHSNMNSIQNPFTLTNPTMEPYCTLLPLMLQTHYSLQVTHNYIAISSGKEL